MKTNKKAAIPKAYAVQNIHPLGLPTPALEFVLPDAIFVVIHLGSKCFYLYGLVLVQMFRLNNWIWVPDILIQLIAITKKRIVNLIII